MALFDALNQNSRISAGLLGLGAGLLQGSTGNYGQFGPALGQGLALAGNAMTHYDQNQMRQQMQQMQALKLQREMEADARVRSFFAPPGGAQPNTAGNSVESLRSRINQAFMSGDPAIIEQASKIASGLNQGEQLGLRSRELDANEWSAPVQTSQGFVQFNRLTGSPRLLTNEDGSVFMPTTIDPTAQGAVSYAKSMGSETAKAEVDRGAAQIERDRQDQKRMELFDVAESVLPKASSGAVSNLRTAAGDAAGISTEASKADAQLRVIAGEMLGLVPRFEGPQSDKDVQAYREMAGDLANPLIPVETRLATLKRMRQMVQDRLGKSGASPAQSGDFSNLWGG